MSISSPIPVPIAVISDWISLFWRTRAKPVLLDVDDLAPDREDRLELRVPCLLCRTSCRVALDDEQLETSGILRRAVRELAGKACRLEQALATGEVSCLPGCGAGLCCLGCLVDDAPGIAGVLVEPLGKGLVHGLLDERLDLGVAELRLRLALELGLRTLAEITAVRPSRTSSPWRFGSFSLRRCVPVRSR